jgi:hypothetical protein
VALAIGSTHRPESERQSTANYFIECGLSSRLRSEYVRLHSAVSRLLHLGHRQKVVTCDLSDKVGMRFANVTLSLLQELWFSLTADHESTLALDQLPHLLSPFAGAIIGPECW